ncbi:MAG TPA: OB-fold domain-containing protein [Noviherbaspirillum sp.]
MTQKMVALGLVAGEGASARLLGGKSRSDGRIVFPLPTGPEAERYDAIELATEGTLWSFTVQRFRPKTPFDGEGDEAKFQPFAVGYVELPGQIIVESRLDTDDFGSLCVGMPMRFTLLPYRRDAGGSEVLTYAFRPIK